MNIVVCPYCLIKGEHKNLAELTPEGIKVIRSVNGSIDYTVIQANDFSIVCGNCHNVVVYRQQFVALPQVNILDTWGTIYTHYAKTSS